MNVNPSDTDVRQGYSPVENAAATGGDTTAAQLQAAPAIAAQTRTADAQSSATSGAEAPAAAEATDARSQAAQQGADKTSAREAAAMLNEHFQKSSTGLKIRVLDDDAHTIQVEVVDTKSNKVLRQIPQDEMLKLSASMRQITGVLVNKPA